MNEFTKTETEEVTKMTVELKTKLTTIEGQEVHVRLPNGGLVTIRVSKLCEQDDIIDVLIHEAEDVTTTLFHRKNQKVSKKKQYYDNLTTWTDLTIE